jgi:protease-4
MKIMKRSLVLSLVFILCTAGCHVHLDILGKDKIEEATLADSRAKDKILLLDISGIIGVMGETGFFPSKEGNILSQVYYRLEKAAEDRRIKGVILRLDTPGGEVTASDILYNEVKEFRARTGIPVVALMMGLSTSGGYYVASACDHIVAHPSTITGSIGVISIFPNVEELFSKIGVEMTIIKSGQMKDSGSPFRDMNAEEQAVFQDIVDGFHQSFLEAVYSGRQSKISRDQLSTLADGRIYTAPQALEQGLIDSIGYFDDALQIVRGLAGVSETKVVSYSYYPKTKTNIYAARLDNFISMDSTEIRQLLQTLKSGFYYLWIPQLTN